MGNLFFGIKGNSIEERTAVGTVLPHSRLPVYRENKEARHAKERAVPTYRDENEYGVYIPGYSTVHANGLYDRNVKRWQTFTGYETNQTRTQYMNEDLDSATYARIKKPSVAPMKRVVFRDPTGINRDNPN